MLEARPVTRPVSIAICKKILREKTVPAHQRPTAFCMEVGCPDGGRFAVCDEEHVVVGIVRKARGLGKGTAHKIGSVEIELLSAAGYSNALLGLDIVGPDLMSASHRYVHLLAPIFAFPKLYVPGGAKLLCRALALQATFKVPPQPSVPRQRLHRLGREVDLSKTMVFRIRNIKNVGVRVVCQSLRAPKLCLFEWPVTQTRRTRSHLLDELPVQVCDDQPMVCRVRNKQTLSNWVDSQLARVL
mmetsp:Transcript_43720/g.71067  ORF Transcript_43720/g.71067 Transcript_43720/m.71067 type:complete len:243 (-) Transcript_43720:1017-1745(-)